MRLPVVARFNFVTFASLLLAACGGGPTGTANAIPEYPTGAFRDAGSSRSSFKPPIVLSVDLATGRLEYWPIQSGQSGSPRFLTGPIGVTGEYGMAANGDVVAVAGFMPAVIELYNVATNERRFLPDPYGNPVDIAIGKDGSLYADNLESVTVYRAPQFQPSQLTCSYVNEGEAVAVDDEGDVFVNGYGPSGFMGVVEYANGNGACAALALKQEKGYVGGVGVDPKTDDLIVVDNPDLCAGGFEGRMVIYPKPYDKNTGTVHNLKAQYCAGTFRLDATSTHIFVADATVSAGEPLIDYLSYPASHPEAVFSGGYFGGFTTIPNTLPN